jgi:MFS family permease
MNNRPHQKLPKSIWVLGFVSLFMDISSEMVHSLLPLFLVTGLGASMATVGIIEGVAESTALISKVFSGYISDYFNRRKWLVVIGYSLSVITKPLFALASSVAMVFSARFIDRIGKGIRGAPRDALIVDITPKSIRGAAFGLRQALDTVGAFIGPLLAFSLMLLWENDFRKIFWVAVIPGAIAIFLLLSGIQEPTKKPLQNDKKASTKSPQKPIHWHQLKLLSVNYWWIVVIASILTLARFSEAFLILKAQNIGISLAYIPLIMVVMNLMFAVSAFPMGKLADKLSQPMLLVCGILVLVVADILLANAQNWFLLILGISLWGLHLGMTQGLLSTLVANEAPDKFRGSCFGVFHLINGIAMLIASVLAGFIWEFWGAPWVFYSGVFWCLMAVLFIGFLKNKPETQGIGL